MRDDDLFEALASMAPDEIAKRRREVAAELIEHGWTITGIANRLGVTPSAVSNWLYRQKRPK